jgi:predicted transcriptional regulator
MPKQKVNPKKLLVDLRSGMEETQIMRKYNVTPGGLQRLIRKMMVSGFLREDELFQWLKLTDSQFFGAFDDTTQNLMDGLEGLDVENAPTTDHLDGMTLLIDKDMIRFADEPAALHIQERLPVHTVGDPGSRGLVRDLAQGSLRVASPDANMFEQGRPKKLSISCELIASSEPVVLTAECQSSRTRGKQRQYYEGIFEIVDITNENLNKIRRLIERLA